MAPLSPQPSHIHTGRNEIIDMILAVELKVLCCYLVYIITDGK
jgi:hypothetical protein